MAPGCNLLELRGGSAAGSTQELPEGFYLPASLRVPRAPQGEMEDFVETGVENELMNVFRHLLVIECTSYLYILGFDFFSPGVVGF